MLEAHFLCLLEVRVLQEVFFFSFLAYLAGNVSGAVNKAVQFKAVLLALNPTSLTIRTLAQRVPFLICH